MILKYLGHSFFTLTLESGMVIAFDPYGDFYEYPKRSVRADVCLISHHHFDHDGVTCIRPGAQVIDTEGTAKLDGVTIESVPTWHDGSHGAQRGANLVHVVEAEGLRIAHAGDLGHVPTEEQRRRIGRPDVLLVPVGGFYTIDAQTALETVRLLRPTTVIPMHYRTGYNPEMTIETLAPFLQLTGAEDTQMPLLRLTRGDMSQRPAVITLAIQP